MDWVGCVIETSPLAHASREISMKKAFLATALVAAVLTGLAAPSIAAPVGIDIRVGPPPARMETVPAPRRGYIWTPGYWDWRGSRHVWVNGVWVRERPGYVYAQPNWVERGGHWRLERGGWARGRGDRDHDGVPNRFDRDRGRDDRDRDGVPNRFDRDRDRGRGDRDRDGIPNRFDSRPDNPRRP